MAIHLPYSLLKIRSGWSRYQDANPVPTIPLTDDVTTAPSGPVVILLSLTGSRRSSAVERPIVKCLQWLFSLIISVVLYNMFDVI